MQIYIYHIYIYNTSNKEHGSYISLLYWLLYCLSTFTFKYWIINAASVFRMKSVFYIHIDIRVQYRVNASSFIWSISERLK